MTWEATEEAVAGGRGRRFSVRRAGRTVPYGDAISALRGEGDGFRAFLTATLATASYRAFKWETPAVTAATAAATPFEFVLLGAPDLLSAAADPSAFAEHLEDGGHGVGDVVTFPNLRGDAVLVVPRPLGPAAAYGHLAAFVRHAPEAQRHALWRAVGDAAAGRLGPRPMWLSTAGMGVPWLHVRLDDRPKYYGHAGYRAGG